MELSRLIYGRHGHSHKDKNGAVICQYDSAAGLGDGFHNWMGALMGCVLSPDKAKLLLDSVIVAIDAVCKGVRALIEKEGLDPAEITLWCEWFSIDQHDADRKAAGVRSMCAMVSRSRSLSSAGSFGKKPKC